MHGLGRQSLTVRTGAAAILGLLAALGLAGSCYTAWRDPQGPRVDPFQLRLNNWEKVLAPVSAGLPPATLIRYAAPHDEQGTPQANGYRYEFVVAVLAPRRVGREVPARYIIADVGTRQGLQRTPGLEQTRVLTKLDPGILLLEKTSP